MARNGIRHYARRPWLHEPRDVGFANDMMTWLLVILICMIETEFARMVINRFAKSKYVVISGGACEKANRC